MKNRFLLILISSLLIISSCSPPSPDDINIIPQPANAFVVPGSFTIDDDTRIITQKELEDVVAVCEYFNDFIEASAGYRLEIMDDENVSSFSGDIVITTFNADTSRDEEGYELKVQGGSSIVLQANSHKGLFYGIQTLLQALPPEVLSKTYVEDLDLITPAMNVFDYPRFKWRGMHLDVCRHFFPKEFIKKYLDLMAMYKMNVFHWHLTEDQGWRIEIRKYPELTEIGAWRTEPDGSRYGGYYTQDDIREIVEYASERMITIVPEIEMPGHSQAALATYPELSCAGGPFEVANLWGVKKDVYCAGKEETFEFLEDVLTEVMELFPGKYIHIGGDEVPKDRWKECPACQARINTEGLADEHELQSYFIRRMEQFLMEHDRKLIGWDEILEGGLAPEATVMSWRGEQGGVEAAQMGHDAVMTPGNYCYFDHYQANPSTQPKAIGGLTPLKEVYHYNPVPAELNEAEQEHILGVQANLWTEYIATAEYAEYMAVPRMLALSEIAWSRDSKIRWERFLRKLENHLLRLDILDVNYCEAVFEVEITPEFNASKQALLIRLRSEFQDAEIRYTIDGSEPNMESLKYDTVFNLNASAKVLARAFIDGEMKGHISSREFKLHKGVGKTAHYKHEYSEKYNGGGNYGLVNGLHGSIHHGDGNWQGFWGEDVEVTIDMGEVTPINGISINFLQNITSWIFLPEQISIMVSDTEDGKYNSIGEFLNAVPKESKDAVIKPFSRSFSDLSTRFVKVVAINPGPCPDWHSGAGEPSWVFVDEVVIE